jgi:hypothetical protein
MAKSHQPTKTEDEMSASIGGGTGGGQWGYRPLKIKVGAKPSPQKRWISFEILKFIYKNWAYNLEKNSGRMKENRQIWKMYNI